MSVIVAAVVVGVAVLGYVVYQLVKSKKAVTIGDAVAAVKADASAIKSDVKSDVKKS
jgi:hypothetical protein